MSDVAAWLALTLIVADLTFRGVRALIAKRREAAKRRGYERQPPPPGVVVKKIRPWDGL